MPDDRPAPPRMEGEGVLAIRTTVAAADSALTVKVEQMPLYGAPEWRPMSFLPATMDHARRMSDIESWDG